MLIVFVTSSVVIVELETVDSVVPVCPTVTTRVDSRLISVVTAGFVEGELGGVTSFVGESVPIVE